MKSLIIVCLFALLAGCNNGLVVLEGYEHATVICGNSLIINDGHYNDPEIKEIVKLAEERCPK